jgi:hypothetical protein
LRSSHYRCHDLRAGHQEMFYMSRGYYQGMAQEDGGMIQEDARVRSYLDYVRIIRASDEVAEGTRHG